jgi:protein-S-isoprenylcysteine O-methyltransferase Ste14
MQHDLGIYIAHAGFFLSFVIARRIAALAPRDQGDARVVSSQATAAPASRILFVAHIGAFFLLYLGIAAAVFGPPPRVLFPPQIVIGLLLIVIGAVLSCWTLLYFRSWRFRAAVGVGHELATGGPFRILRHPIYLSLTLLALGTALWHPTPFIWVSFVILALLSDLRARAEETLLLRVYGETYAKYCERTRRFIPAIY